MEHEEWQALSDDARYALVDSILIEHERFNALYREITQYARVGLTSRIHEPPCLAIMGDTGAGKSTLIRTWLTRTPERETPTATIIPYLYVIVPAYASMKAAAAAILTKLHDPNPSRGTEWNMTMRIYRLMAACQVQMVIIDELQHLINKERQHQIAHRVADFFKTILLETHVPMVVVGHTQEMQEIFAANSQLDRRFGTPRLLTPFMWDRARPDDTIAEFCELLGTIDAALPLDPSGLGEEAMAYRFFYATNGYLGWVMHLVRHAAFAAIRTPCHGISLELLAAAYQERVAGTIMGKNKDNPFTPAFKGA
ncbi:MAG: TniB family NTP-binding protein [Ktedonobacterales bacterium]|nr:TniB family NTP-binding protein [Ktedonobacterales bacterium]